MNKIERVRTVLNGGVPDKVPAGFWFHYPHDFTVKEMVKAHVDLIKHTDMDVVKIMQDFMYPISGKITNVSDWYNIKIEGINSLAFQKQTEIVKRILDQVGGEVLSFQTMFGPFKAASFAFGDDVLMAHAKENPKAVATGVETIAQTLHEWANGYLEAGVDGIYFSAQFGEVGRFTEEQWSELVRPSDLKVLSAAQNRSDKYNVLHICGEPEYDFKVHFDRYNNYPSDIVNWSVKDNSFSLSQGRELFGRPVLGGLNNKGNILKGTDEDIRREVEEVIDGFDSRSLLVGADCTLQGANISHDKIRTAVEATHNYKFE